MGSSNTSRSSLDEKRDKGGSDAIVEGEGEGRKGRRGRARDGFAASDELFRNASSPKQGGASVLWSIQPPYTAS